MNKKYLSFIIVGILTLSLVAAVVVPYLGNKVEMNAGVDSPMQYLINDLETNVLNIDSVYGGESVTFTVKANHLASVDTVVEAENILRNEDGITCEDVISASVHATSKTNDVQTWETTLNLGDGSFTCEELTNKEVRYYYGQTVDTYVPDREDTMDVTVTFAPNALGNYKFTATPLYP